MSILNLKSTKGKLKTKDGKTLNYRVYSYGWVKIEGENIRRDFTNLLSANQYIALNHIKVINQDENSRLFQ